MRSLVLEEKPSVGRDIARVLHCHKKNNSYIEGEQYIVWLKNEQEGEETKIDVLVESALAGNLSAQQSINQYVYKIYQLSDDEQLYIENSSSVK